MTYTEFVTICNEHLIDAEIVRQSEHFQVFANAFFKVKPTTKMTRKDLVKFLTKNY